MAAFSDLRPACGRCVTWCGELQGGSVAAERGVLWLRMRSSGLLFARRRNEILS